MKESTLWVSKSADELRTERDKALAYLQRIAEPDTSTGFIDRRLLAIEALERLAPGLMRKPVLGTDEVGPTT